jgi:hypothetical protein
MIPDGPPAAAMTSAGSGGGSHSTRSSHFEARSSSLGAVARQWRRAHTPGSGSLAVALLPRVTSDIANQDR